MTRQLSLYLLLATLALAAPPVATVSSSGSLSLNGVTLAPNGVPSWPLVPGDTLATSAAPAVILFQDRTRLTVEKNSKLKLDRDGGRLLVRLLEGALAYHLAPSSQLRFASLPSPPAPQGKLSIKDNQLIAAPPGTAQLAGVPRTSPPAISSFR